MVGSCMFIQKSRRWDIYYGVRSKQQHSVLLTLDDTLMVDAISVISSFSLRLLLPSFTLAKWHLPASIKHFQPGPVPCAQLIRLVSSPKQDGRYPMQLGDIDLQFADSCGYIGFFFWIFSVQTIAPRFGDFWRSQWRQQATRNLRQSYLHGGGCFAQVQLPWYRELRWLWLKLMTVTLSSPTIRRSRLPRGQQKFQGYSTIPS